MKKYSISLVVSFILLISVICVFSQETTDIRTSKSQEADKPLKIKRKPHPSVGNCSESKGLVVIRVTFDKSATISETEIVVSSGCESFDKRSLKAAQKIEFEPAEKSGEPITVTKKIEYAFSRY